ncbi:MAG: hypothetical protein Q9O74_07185 [Planctomycetota bacterium]|nr:hypothetical protein [Planctomycetota bacterium]
MGRTDTGWQKWRVGVLAGVGVLGFGIGPVGVVRGQVADAPLAGPRVERREVPGVRAEYVSGGATRTFAAEQMVPLPSFFGALRELDGEGAAAELRLTPEQRTIILDDVHKFGAELRAFVAAHGGEIRGLIAELPQAERGRVAGELRNVERMVQVLDRVERTGGAFGDRRSRARDAQASTWDGKTKRAASEDGGFRIRIDAAGDDPMDSMSGGAPMMQDRMQDRMQDGMQEGAMDARGRLIELRGVVPSVGGLQTRVWDALTPAQQEVFGASLTRYLAEAKAQNEARRLQRDIERREAATQKNRADVQRDRPRQTDAKKKVSPADADARRKAQLKDAMRANDAMIGRLLKAVEMGAIPQQVWERLPARLREKLERLPEDERAAALTRWLRDLQGKPSGG